MSMEASPSILDRRLVVPEHVVSRSFAEQTVLLNLESGNYHGLNPIAVRMIEASKEAPTPRDVVATLASEYEQTEAVIERDLTELLEGLAERGLVLTDPDDAG